MRIPPSSSFSLLTKLPALLTNTSLSPLRTMTTISETFSSLPPISPSTTRIGWIGTGVMGLSMCKHLITNGYTLTVFTRTPSKAQPLITLGATFVETPYLVAQSSDVVFSIVGYPRDVEHVLLHPVTGALSGLKPGGVLVDMTTSNPSLAVRVNDAAVEKGCISVDAPVSGGDKGAKEGKLAIFAGGEEREVQRLKPLWDCLGSVSYMGRAGKGQYGKLANQVMIASSMVGLVEGMVFACKSGLDVGLFLEAIRGGAAGSKSLELYGGRIMKRDFEAGFFVNHFVKDLGICLRECQVMGLALPGLALAQQLYLSLQAHGEGGLGTQALVLALERLNNIDKVDYVHSASQPQCMFNECDNQEKMDRTDYIHASSEPQFMFYECNNREEHPDGTSHADHGAFEHVDTDTEAHEQQPSSEHMDFTPTFTTDMVFHSRDDLIAWARDVGKSVGTVVVIKRADYSDANRVPRISFCCERSGQARPKKGVSPTTKRTRKSSSKKCGCPFSLRGIRLPETDKWMVRVECGSHNHPITSNLGGHSYARRLNPKEKEVVIKMTRCGIKPKDILAVLKDRDKNNLSTMNNIYNTMNKVRLEQMKIVHQENPQITSNSAQSN